MFAPRGPLFWAVEAITRENCRVEVEIRNTTRPLPMTRLLLPVAWMLKVSANDADGRTNNKTVPLCFHTELLLVLEC